MTTKKNARESKEEVVNVRMTGTQKRSLEALAAREGLGLSTWLLNKGLLLLAAQEPQKEAR